MSGILEYYDEFFDRYGPNDARALAWRDDTSQQTRFQVLSEVAELAGSSILDEGCGLGDLYGFLASRVPGFEYRGIDLNERFIASAREKYPGVSFEVADFSIYEGEPVDYVLASGTLTFRVPGYRDVYFAQIAKMVRLARKAVAFNFLNASRFEGNEYYVTYTREEMYDFCKTLTDTITVRDDYSPEDFTFYLYR